MHHRPSALALFLISSLSIASFYMCLCTCSSEHPHSFVPAAVGFDNVMTRFRRLVILRSSSSNAGSCPSGGASSQAKKILH